MLLPGAPAGGLFDKPDYWASSPKLSAVVMVGDLGAQRREGSLYGIEIQPQRRAGIGIDGRDAVIEGH